MYLIKFYPSLLCLLFYTLSFGYNGGNDTRSNRLYYTHFDFNCTAIAGTITASSSSVPLVNGSASISALPDGNQSVPQGYQSTYVLTKGANLVVEEINSLPIFTVTSAGGYRIHTLVYSPVSLDLNTIIPGISTGYDIDGLLIQGGGTICGSLDLAGAPINVITNPNCTADAGTISPTNPSVLLTNGSASISALSDGNQVVPTGFQTTYLLTKGAGLVIEQTGNIPIYTVTSGGDYTIHTLVFNSTTFDLSAIVLGVTTGFDINAQLIQGGGAICGSLDVPGAPIIVVDPQSCLAEAGTVVATPPTVLLDNGAASLSAAINGDQVIPAGYVKGFLLTKGVSLTIEQVANTPTFTATSAGNFFIQTLVYDPNTFDLNVIVPGVTTNSDVNAFFIPSGGTICGSLDGQGALITVVDPLSCTTSAGTISAAVTDVVLTNGSASIEATTGGDQIVPPAYNTTFILTKGTIIEQLNGTPTFSVTSGGDYSIHTLVFDATTLDIFNIISLGSTIIYDLNAQLIQGGGTICGSLDLTGAPITVIDPQSCTADAGTISAIASTVSLNNGIASLSATPDGNQIKPMGFQTLYLLTKGANLVIERYGATPSFSAYSLGDYSIHTLIYDPGTLDITTIVLGTTKGADVNALLVQGGGLICGALNLTGAPISVIDPQSCTTDAGTITATASSVALTNGSATLSATPDGKQTEPTGYQTTFVLTSGSGLVIEQLGGTPSFTVNASGDFSIHTLVYNPNTLDVSTIQLGVTTGFDVNTLLIQGGGGICGSLDVVGAPIQVIGPANCFPDAGTITAYSSSYLLTNASVLVLATPDGNQIIPSGYRVAYVLTKGAGLVIEQLSAIPFFTVTSTGDYTIHTLVYDQNTLDVSTIQQGVTTGFGVDALLIQGGGSICASLDVAGAPVQVINPQNCIVDAGTITADANPVLLNNASATITATLDGNQVVPSGYQTAYVLTKGTGLVIEQLGAAPAFIVTSLGEYAIHTLVYNPATFDVSIVVPGTTTGFDVDALLIQGGGSICGSLDVVGAAIAVTDPQSCLADAGSITANTTPIVLSGQFTQVGATVSGNQVIPQGYQQLFVLTEGAGLVIRQLSPFSSFYVFAAGDYKIHTLIYDPNTLDLTTVQFGITTGADVNGLLIQGGGSICGALDTTGASIQVVGQ